MLKRINLFLKDTDGVQVQFGTRMVELNFPYLGIAILIAFILSIVRKSWDDCFLLFFLTGAGFSSILIFSGDNSRFYSSGHIYALIFLIGNGAEMAKGLTGTVKIQAQMLSVYRTLKTKVANR